MNHQSADAGATIPPPIPPYCYCRGGYLSLRKRPRKERRHWRKIVQNAVHPYAAEWDKQRGAMRRLLKKPGAADAFGLAIGHLAQCEGNTPFSGRFA